jgi:hypothetical protein
MTTGKGRGFKSMTAEKRAEVARKGGLSAQAKGKAYRFDSESAKAAASKPRGPRKSKIGKFEAMPAEVFRRMIKETTFEQLANTVAAMAAEILPNVQGAYISVLHEGPDGRATTTSKMLTITRGDGWSVVSAVIEGMERDIAACDEKAKEEGLVRVPPMASMAPTKFPRVPSAAVGGKLKLVKEAKQTNGGVECDAPSGEAPCACGAWHVDGKDKGQGE